MIELVFVTNNPNKVREIRTILGNSFKVLSLSEIGFEGDIPETQETIQGNAVQKARFIHDRFGVNCFADDTGLEINALDGRPGVISARYAGEHCSPVDNMTKVLDELQGVEGRACRFRTAIALILNGNEHSFEGEVGGTITTKRSGSEGFGYDPIFQPDGYDITFAEMDLEEKNRISHRGKAVRKLAEFLSSSAPVQ